MNIELIYVSINEINKEEVGSLCECNIIKIKG